MDFEDKFNICTIIAKNYVAFARTLCNSFYQHHPSGKCYVLIIDDINGYIDIKNEKFEILRLEEIGIPNIQEFCFKYNITELSTAVKPHLLKHLFDTQKIGKILYLDPDILITSPLYDLYERLNVSDVLLTPHLDKDYPDDGLLPDDAHIMKSGIFNLGFIGLRKCENVDQFLRWWQRKLYNKCVIEHTKGYFVDQKFIDLAIVLFPHFSVIYETGYNVAYWNLHSREVHSVDGKWMCNNNDLNFYHFSNYKPEKAHEISGHQTRFRLKDLPELTNLFMHYNKLLIDNGYFESKNWPYTYSSFTNGEVINDLIRKIYRRKLIEKKIKNPFDIHEYSLYYRLLFVAIRLYKKGTKFLLKKFKRG